MENTNNPQAEVDNQAVLPNPAESQETVTISKDDWSKVQQTMAKHERLLKKVEGQTIDKEMVASVQELAFNQKVTKLSNEAEISSELAEQLFKLKADFNKTDLENPIFKNLIDANKRQARVSNNTPGGSFAGNDLPKDFSSMSRADKINNFRSIMGVK